MKNKLTLDEKHINFLAKARKRKGVTIDVVGIFNISAQIWSKNRRTLEDLSQVCPVDFDIQKVNEEYMMQLYCTAKAEY